MYQGIETFGKIVEHRAKSRPTDRFVRFESSDLTYNQFHLNGNKAANAFIQLGMTKGDTVAVMLPNSPEFLAVWLGLTRIGVIEVPINTAFRGDLLTYILNKAECKAIVISSKWVERINQIESDLLHLQHVIVVEDGKIPIPHNMGWYSFEELISRASENDIDILIQPKTLTYIIYFRYNRSFKRSYSHSQCKFQRC